jgi:hypothetical protein
MIPILYLESISFLWRQPHTLSSKRSLMTITLENDNNVIVYIFDKIISHAGRTQQLLVAQELSNIGERVLGAPRNCQEAVRPSILAEQIHSSQLSPLQDSGNDEAGDDLEKFDLTFKPTKRFLQLSGKDRSEFKACNKTVQLQKRSDSRAVRDWGTSFLGSCLRVKGNT